MANTLDDLFQWAGSQPVVNQTKVNIAIATNELTRNNLVSYAEGALQYSPAHFTGMLWSGASFRSQQDGITVYYSDRRFGSNSPFNPQDTDPLDVRILAPLLLSMPYTIVVHSSKWGFEHIFNPSFDPNTGIILATIGPILWTLSLCNWVTIPPTL